jgi:hypothetical protein
LFGVTEFLVHIGSVRQDNVPATNGGSSGARAEISEGSRYGSTNGIHWASVVAFSMLAIGLCIQHGT